MEFNKDIKLFNKFGFLFYEYIGDKSIEEILEWIQQIIQQGTNRQAINKYQKMAKAILTIRYTMPDDKLNSILEKEFGLFADPVPIEKSHVKKI